MNITVKRTIKAKPEAIYDVWLDPKSPGGPWFGATRAIVEPRVDGLFYFAVGHEGREWPHYGRFVALERGARIVHTWVSEATRGIETTVTITLTPDGDRTAMTLVHENVPDDEMGRNHQAGWEFITGAIEARFAR